MWQQKTGDIGETGVNVISDILNFFMLMFFHLPMKIDNSQKTICFNSLGTNSTGQRKEDFPTLMGHSSLCFVQRANSEP